MSYANLAISISYLQSLNRISALDYLPSDRDILFSRNRTTRIEEVCFSIKEGSGDRRMQLRVFDLGGSRVQRKEWIHTFDNVDLIIFTVDIACYDQLLLENKTVNSMQEALTLFDSIVNSRFFSHTKMILCFTKKGKLAEKIVHSPVKNYFPNFEGGDNLEAAIEYIIKRFVSLNEDSLKELVTIVLEDTLSLEEWYVIKEEAFKACDSGAKHRTKQLEAFEPETKQKKWLWRNPFNRGI